jgi:hypothetical protein
MLRDPSEPARPTSEYVRPGRRIASTRAFSLDPSSSPDPTALPIVAPAAAVIITLPVFYLVELLVWLPLKLTHAIRTRRIN